MADGAKPRHADRQVRRAGHEASLRENAALLERLFDTVHVLIAYMDTEFRFVRVNRAYAEADGREPADFVGKKHFDLYPNEENETIFRDVLRSGTPYVATEKPFVYPEHPERGVTYWDWNLRPVPDAQGHTTGLLLTLVDVTERVYARKAVEAQRQRLYDVLNMLPGLVALVAPDQYFVQYANRHFETGRPVEWERTVPSGRTFHMRGYPFRGTDSTRLVLELGVDVTEQRRLRNEVVTASEQERQRVGRDLHDSLGQDLSGVGYLAEALASQLAAVGSPLAENADQIANLIQKACREVRSVARGLCPVEVREEGLADALRDLAEQTREIYGVPCDLECPGPVPVHDIAAATDLYRIAQEAVTNAVRHAQPNRITVRGLPEDLDPEAGMGLRVMRYRAQRVGGVLEANRRPEGGTVISCVVHLPPDQDEATRRTAGQADPTAAAGQT